ncbi:MAG: hypothetical protein QW051_01235 [Candidatus Aenigmatarchaeota archaeon]
MEWKQIAIIMKCPKCGVAVELFYSEIGWFGQGKGWYCPNCLTLLIPPHSQGGECDDFSGKSDA